MIYFSIFIQCMKLKERVSIDEIIKINVYWQKIKKNNSCKNQKNNKFYFCFY